MLPFAVLMLAPALTAIPEEIERAGRVARRQPLAHAPPRRAADGAAGADRRRHRRLHADPHRLRHAGDPRRRHATTSSPTPSTTSSSAPRDPGLGATLTMLLVVLGSAVVGIIFAAARHRHARPDAEERAMSAAPKPWRAVARRRLLADHAVGCRRWSSLGASFTAGKIIAFPPDGLSLQLVRGDRRGDRPPRRLPALALCRDGLHAGRHPGSARSPAWRSRKYRLRYEKAIQLYLLLPFTIPLIGSGIGLMLIFGSARRARAALAGRHRLLRDQPALHDLGGGGERQRARPRPGERGGELRRAAGADLLRRHAAGRDAGRDHRRRC